MDERVSLEDIRGLIKDATNCAGLTYTNLFAMLVLKDLIPFMKVFVDNIKASSLKQLTEDNGDAINEECDNDPEIQNVQATLDGEKPKDTTKKFNITTTSIYDEYRMNFNIFTCKGQLQFQGIGELEGNKLEMDSTWKNIMRKRATLDVEYRIDAEAFNSICNRVGTVEPAVVDLYEIIWILISTVRNTGEKLQTNCVAHDGSFVKKYESISSELGEEFAQLIEELDENKDIIWQLLRDFFSQFDDSSEEISQGSSEETSDVALWEFLEQFFDEAGGDDTKQDDNNHHCNNNRLDVIVPHTDPFYIHRANFKDKNITAISLDIPYDREPEEKSRFENATIRKLSFSTSFENDFKDDDFDGDESNNKVSGTKKNKVYYYFKGTVKVSLS
ncbi:uncharacterized protein LOC126838243 [Adelges cooleyi]|uniref:uncharacterized protein LOC126838243 n=1 Tax=Adelges cooleyi TaxID=133065 RepID=UPI0021808627|nr:uncharacterized protein LOC126838243 [Adelges cooleyi]